VSRGVLTSNKLEKLNSCLLFLPLPFFNISASDSCGTTNNEKCIFPFEFRQRVYHVCFINKILFQFLFIPMSFFKYSDAQCFSIGESHSNIPGTTYFWVIIFYSKDLVIKFSPNCFFCFVGRQLSNVENH